MKFNRDFLIKNYGSKVPNWAIIHPRGQHYNLVVFIKIYRDPADFVGLRRYM